MFPSASCRLRSRAEDGGKRDKHTPAGCGRGGASGAAGPGWCEKGVGAGVEGNPLDPPLDIPSSTFNRWIPAANCSGRIFPSEVDNDPGEMGVGTGVPVNKDTMHCNSTFYLKLQEIGIPKFMLFV